MLYLGALGAFFALHVLPFRPDWRAGLVTRLGESRYKLLFRALVLGLIALGVLGWQAFPYVHLYEPPFALKLFHIVLMLPVVYLWVIAEVPNNARRYIRHPMLTGMVLWAIGHLLANGDVRSMILFVSFLGFSLISVRLSNKREVKAEVRPKTPWRYDLGTIIAAVVIYLLLLNFHGNLFGMPVRPYLGSL